MDPQDFSRPPDAIGDCLMSGAYELESPDQCKAIFAFALTPGMEAGPDCAEAPEEIRLSLSELEAIETIVGLNGAWTAPGRFRNTPSPKPLPSPTPQAEPQFVPGTRYSSSNRVGIIEENSQTPIRTFSLVFRTASGDRLTYDYAQDRSYRASQWVAETGQFVQNRGDSAQARDPVMTGTAEYTARFDLSAEDGLIWLPHPVSPAHYRVVSAQDPQGKALPVYRSAEGNYYLRAATGGAISYGIARAPAPTPESATYTPLEGVNWLAIDPQLGGYIAALRTARGAAEIRAAQALRHHLSTKRSYTWYNVDIDRSSAQRAARDLFRQSNCSWSAMLGAELLHAAGKPVRIANGLSQRGIPHAWIEAQLDGRWRILDFTRPEQSLAERAEISSDPMAHADDRAARREQDSLDAVSSPSPEALKATSLDTATLCFTGAQNETELNACRDLLITAMQAAVAASDHSLINRIAEYAATRLSPGDRDYFNGMRAMAYGEVAAAIAYFERARAVPEATAILTSIANRSQTLLSSTAAMAICADFFAEGEDYAASWSAGATFSRQDIRDEIQELKTFLAVWQDLADSGLYASSTEIWQAILSGSSEHVADSTRKGCQRFLQLIYNSAASEPFDDATWAFIAANRFGDPYGRVLGEGRGTAMSVILGSESEDAEVRSTLILEQAEVNLVMQHSPQASAIIGHLFADDPQHADRAADLLAMSEPNLLTASVRKLFAPSHVLELLVELGKLRVALSIGRSLRIAAMGPIATAGFGTRLAAGALETAVESGVMVPLNAVQASFSHDPASLWTGKGLFKAWMGNAVVFGSLKIAGAGGAAYREGLADQFRFKMDRDVFDFERGTFVPGLTPAGEFRLAIGKNIMAASAMTSGGLLAESLGISDPLPGNPILAERFLLAELTLLELHLAGKGLRVVTGDLPNTSRLYRLDPARFALRQEIASRVQWIEAQLRTNGVDTSSETGQALLRGLVNAHLRGKMDLFEIERVAALRGRKPYGKWEHWEALDPYDNGPSKKPLRLATHRLSDANATRHTSIDPTTARLRQIAAEDTCSAPLRKALHTLIAALEETSSHIRSDLRAAETTQTQPQSYPFSPILEETLWAALILAARGLDLENPQVFEYLSNPRYDRRAPQQMDLLFEIQEIYRYLQNIQEDYEAAISYRSDTDGVTIRAYDSNIGFHAIPPEAERLGFYHTAISSRTGRPPDFNPFSSSLPARYRLSGPYRVIQTQDILPLIKPKFEDALERQKRAENILEHAIHLYELPENCQPLLAALRRQVENSAWRFNRDTGYLNTIVNPNSLQYPFSLMTGRLLWRLLSALAREGAATGNNHPAIPQLLEVWKEWEGIADDYEYMMAIDSGLGRTRRTPFGVRIPIHQYIWPDNPLFPPTREAEALGFHLSPDGGDVLFNRP